MRQRSFNWAIAATFLTTLLLLFSSFQYLSEQKLRKQDAAFSIAHQAELEGNLRELQEALLQEHEHAATLEAAAQHSHDGFAYVFYATTNEYACSVLVNVHRLRNELNSTLPVHILITNKLNQEYIDAFHAANVTVHLETPPPLTVEEGFYYEDCLLKLLAFKMHKLDPRLKRVLVFDGDQLIMKNMDSLFSGLPPVDLAAPRAYWINKDALASTFMMIDLSDRLWELVQRAITRDYEEREIKMDMDLMNELLGDTVMMLSGEYVTLNSHWETWNLPKWFHPTEISKSTSVEQWNKLVEETGGVEGRGLGVEAAWLPQKDYGREEDVSSLAEVAGHRAAAEATAGQSSASAEAAESSASASEAQAIDIGTHQYDGSQTKPTTSPDSQASNDDNNDSQEHEPTPEPIVPVPRFPPHHPIFKDLDNLYAYTPIIHFTAGGKPWMSTSRQMAENHPYAHPLLADQVATWRMLAKGICPGWAHQEV